MEFRMTKFLSVEKKIVIDLESLYKIQDGFVEINKRNQKPIILLCVPSGIIRNFIFLLKDAISILLGKKEFFYLCKSVKRIENFIDHPLTIECLYKRKNNLRKLFLRKK